MKAEDARYDPCCATCAWSDSYYEGAFHYRLCCCRDPKRVYPVRPEHVCREWEEESR